MPILSELQTDTLINPSPFGLCQIQDVQHIFLEHGAGL